MPASCPIDRLHAVVAIVQTCSPELSSWLSDALEDHIRLGNSIDYGLGLVGHLGRSPRFKYLERQRAIHLEAALAALGGDVHRLAQEVRSFEEVPAVERGAPEPRPHWQPWRRHIHAAARLGLKVPSSVPGLEKAIAKNGTCGVAFSGVAPS